MKTYWMSPQTLRTSCLPRNETNRSPNALQSLPENQRIALILKRYDDLSYKEISRVLGCSIPQLNHCSFGPNALSKKNWKNLEKKAQVFGLSVV